MSFGYIARSMGQRLHNALARRRLHLYRLTIPHGGSIAVVYSRLPLPLDYEFASNSPDSFLIRLLPKMVSKTPLYVFDYIVARCCVLMCVFTVHNSGKSLYFNQKCRIGLPYNTQTKRLTKDMFNQVFTNIVNNS